MNISQLRAICEVVKQGMKISTAAEVLCKAQPGISRQIMEIEAEIGVQIFHRLRNRICGLTPAGEEVLQVAQRMLLDVENLKAIGKEYTSHSTGELIVATTHTNARYSLPPVVEQFIRDYPEVKLTLRQVGPRQAYELVAGGTADIAICTEAPALFPELVSLPVYRVVWDVIAAIDHPILRERPITLSKLAKYPIITQTFSGQGVITEAFAKAGQSPRIMITGADADVSKVYVARKLGLAVLQKVAYEPARDKKLTLLNAQHLFQPSVMSVSIRRHHYLRSYALSFISRYAPHLALDIVRKAVAGERIDQLQLRRKLPELATID